MHADTPVIETRRLVRRFTHADAVNGFTLRGAPGPLSLGWAARDRGESLPALVARASAQRVPVLVRDHGESRRAGEEAAGVRAGPGFSSRLGAGVVR